MKDGKRRWLAPLTTSIELHQRWPAWIDDPALVGELSRWLDDEDHEKRAAAIWAFAGGPLNGDVKGLVEQSLTKYTCRYIDSPDIVAYEVRQWLRAVELLGFEELNPFQAAPDAWLTLVMREIEEDGNPNLPVVAGVFPHLPDAQRVALARVLYQAGTEWELPWQQITDGGGSLVYARPADVIDRVLFEAGLLIVEDAEDPVTPGNQTAT